MAQQNNRKTPLDPRQTLDHIRQKMETLAGDFAEGKINKDQFNAVYHHYAQQMEIVQRLIEKDPQSDAWRKAAAPGVTEFLKEEFRPGVTLCATLRLKEDKPLYIEGKVTPDVARAIYSAFKTLRASGKIGLVSREIVNGWLVAFVGDLAVTLVVFTGEPTTEQVRRVEDIHRVFERANGIALRTNAPVHRYVFPQRSLSS
ncbi:MAG: hypothetical protein IT298_11190 [Chloroflexi bacterium]|nr:hypothetical protein [Anaerolineae bacterium]MCC6566318.1 hypothetical protein [Chloroflexota bacterium]